MKTYSEREVFSKVDLVYHRIATRLVQGMPHFDQQGREVRCHEVARAVKSVISAETVVVQDGLYDLGCQHSWLQLPSEHILDTYAVGRVPPVQLVAAARTLPPRYVARDIDLVVREHVVSYILQSMRWRP